MPCSPYGSYVMTLLCGAGASDLSFHPPNRGFEFCAPPCLTIPRRRDLNEFSVLHFCEWLANTDGSVALHESIYVYPVIESIHVLTLCLFLGLAVMLDLRLLGVGLARTPVSQLTERLMPWTVAGFVVMVISGALLFYGIPVRTYQNIFFRIKVVLLILSGLNAFVFHSTIYRRVAEWDTAPVPPLRARLAGGFSLLFWAGVVVAGRMIAYNWFDQPQP
jgi:hypothetical protein